MAHDCKKPDFEILTGLSPLSPEEVSFCERLVPLFAMVDSQKPEKGMRILILRARTRLAKDQISIQTALDQEYDGARERTEARLKLLGNCSINPTSPGES